MTCFVYLLSTMQEGKASLQDNLKKTIEERDRLREERDQALADKQQLISDKTELSLRQDEADLRQRQFQDQLDRESQAKIDVSLAGRDPKTAPRKDLLVSSTSLLPDFLSLGDGVVPPVSNYVYNSAFSVDSRDLVEPSVG